MPALNIKFDRHGLGDCVHFAHALQLYKRRGYDVTVQAEENKLFVWKVAGVNIVQGGGLPDHSYHYPAGFDDLNLSDCDTNKVAFGLRHDVMPPLEDLGLTPQQAWDELCDVRLSAHDFIPPEAHQEAEAFLAGLPRPIICFHSRGTNWHERKSLPTDVAFDVILQLLDQTGGSVVVLDFDHRAPMVGHERCKGIKPTWGHIGIDRLCALYERSDLMIGVDSGPFHVASLTNVKTLGVFRSLHPNRVCLPNPNTVYLASWATHQRWKHYDASRWKPRTYSGREPLPMEIVKAACDMLHGRDNEICDWKFRSDRYLYRRIGHDERYVTLEPDGTISEGLAECEQRWTLRTCGGEEFIDIYGSRGVICTCRATEENPNHFVGRWNQFERMPIELIRLVETNFHQSSPMNVEVGSLEQESLSSL